MPGWLKTVGRAVAFVVPFGEKIANRIRARRARKAADALAQLRKTSQTAEAVAAEVRRRERDRGERR